MDRNAVMATIKAALKRRSGRTWSVRGGKGTGYGWITIDVPPKERTWHFDYDHPTEDARGFTVYPEYCDASKEFGYMGPEDREQLAQMLGLETVHHQGVSIPAHHDYYQEYIDRAEGRAPTIIGQRYWD